MLLTQGWGQIAESSNYACTPPTGLFSLNFLSLTLIPWACLCLCVWIIYQHRAGMRIHVSKSTLQKLQQAREFQWFCQSTGKVVSSSTIIYKRPHKSGQECCWRENEVSRKAEPILPMRLLCPRWWRICPLTLRGSESCSMEAQFSSAGNLKGGRVGYSGDTVIQGGIYRVGWWYSDTRLDL